MSSEQECIGMNVDRTVCRGRPSQGTCSVRRARFDWFPRRVDSRGGRAARPIPTSAPEDVRFRAHDIFDLDGPQSPK